MSKSGHMQSWCSKISFKDTRILFPLLIPSYLGEIVVEYDGPARGHRHPIALPRDIGLVNFVVEAGSQEIAMENYVLHKFPHVTGLQVPVAVLLLWIVHVLILIEPGCFFNLKQI